MPASSDVQLGLWSNYDLGYFDRWQILASDYYSRCETAFVAVCLTLAGPSVFKISKRFLAWVICLFGWLEAEWVDSSIPGTDTPGTQTQSLLTGKRAGDYGTLASFQFNGKPKEPKTPSELDAQTKASREHSISSKDEGPSRGQSSSEPPMQDPGDGKQKAAEPHRGLKDNPQDTAADTNRISHGQSSSEPPLQEPRDGKQKAAEPHRGLKYNPQDTAADTNRISHGSSSLQAPENSERQPQHPQPAHRAKGLADKLWKSNSSRETTWEFVRYVVHRGAKLYTSETTFVVVITTILFGLFVAWTVAGIFSAKIASNKAALSSSTSCGIWRFNTKAGDEADYRNDLNNHQKEARASQYARNCYNSPDPTDSLGCNFFYNQSIAFTTKSYQKCPFESPELCLDGLYSATTFDTGYVGASVVGINSPVTHSFRRKTSCSPLNMTYPYVRKEFSEDPNGTSYHYYYGPTDNNEFTFKTFGNPFEWLVPVYSVNTYFSSLYPEDDFWRPSPKLMPPRNSTLTIVFVSSMHIYHIKPSFDPIFPATKPRYFDGIIDPYYFNSDPKARAFACVDTTELCSADGKNSWSMTALLPHNIPDSAAYWLMKWSLESSTIYDSIKWRLGKSLLVQDSISQSVSNPLSSNQWEIEASQLFATSLARIQYDAWGIARGEDRELPGYVEVTPDEAKGRLCKIFMFNTIGYTNVNLLGFIGLPLVAFVIFILSLNASSVGWRRTSPMNDDERTPPGEPLIIDLTVRFICGLLLNIFFVAIWCIAWPFRKLRRYWAL